MTGTNRCPFFLEVIMKHTFIGIALLSAALKANAITLDPVGANGEEYNFRQPRAKLWKRYIRALAKHDHTSQHIHRHHGGC